PAGESGRWFRPAANKTGLLAPPPDESPDAGGGTLPRTPAPGRPVPPGAPPRPGANQQAAATNPSPGAGRQAGAANHGTQQETAGPNPNPSPGAGRQATAANHGTQQEAAGPNPGAGRQAGAASAEGHLGGVGLAPPLRPLRRW